jgi:hypothetical protein
MPRDQVTATARQALKAAATSGAEAAAVRDLADGFDVSEQAMDYRLINLGLRRQV